MKAYKDCIRIDDKGWVLEDGILVDMACVYKHRLADGDVLTKDRIGDVEDIWINLKRGDTFLARIPGEGWYAVPRGDGLRKAVRKAFDFGPEV